MNAVTLPLLAALAASLPAQASQAPTSQCQIDQAQRLMEQQPRPVAQIDALLVQCRTVGSHDYRVDLLAGVLAREEGRLADAIEALTRAHQQAPGELAPALELAVTYEFQQRPEQARRGSAWRVSHASNTVPTKPKPSTASC
jgi:lipopolysaccharide biosynthesis regulator YciM